MRGNVFYNSYDNFIYNRKYALRDYKTGATKPGVEGLLAKLPASISSLTIAENRDKAYIYGAELVTRIDYGALLGAANGLSSTFAVGYNQGKSKSSYSGDGWVELDLSLIHICMVFMRRQLVASLLHRTAQGRFRLFSVTSDPPATAGPGVALTRLPQIEREQGERRWPRMMPRTPRSKAPRSSG